ncbi:MAG: hypothetical protein KDA44_08060 [Planctomycetales bacterium]|nr:hypothetical protein [Planctomycetales bacterium]
MRTVFVLAGWLIAGHALAAPSEWLAPSPWYDELWGTRTETPDVRIHVNAPAASPDAAEQPARLVIFALPNGNTLEQSLGCQMSDGLDWHFDIQHIAAQTRLLRTAAPEERITLLAAEAQGLSWPAWRASHDGANERIVALVDQWRREFGGDDARVALTAHSGGGSFLWGVLEGQDEIPAWVDTIAFLDANYSFDAEQHAGKFLRWLQGDSARRLVVLAYDDREITYQGKKVVGSTGGTYRATQRMVDAFAADAPLERTDGEPFTHYEGLGGQIRMWVHKNPANKILHTALVGDMNGYLHALTTGTPQAERWGEFAGPRAYNSWVQPAPTPTDPAAATKLPRLETLPPVALPPRPPGAVGGAEFAQRIADLPAAEREAAIFAELAAGNFPQFLRTFQHVEFAATGADGAQATIAIDVAPDVLAIGSDDDFLRIPMTPQTAQRLADRWGCTLPTRKLVDAIDAAATVRLAPQPLTEDRESVVAFVESNRRIEAQRAGQPLGPLVTGAKKDVVLTPRIFERPRRLALYGWRQLDGTPIQPLTIVHHNGYVDYSHGVRLVRNAAIVDGEVYEPVENGDRHAPQDKGSRRSRQRSASQSPFSAGCYAISELLADPGRSAWVSDEGAMIPPRYPEQ